MYYIITQNIILKKNTSNGVRAIALLALHLATPLIYNMYKIIRDKLINDEEQYIDKPV